MNNLLVKVLIGVTLFLLALTVYNNKVIDSKNKEVLAIQEKQKASQEKLDNISLQLETLNTQIEVANQSYNRLTLKIDAVDKKKNNYTKEIKEIKDANEDTKLFLDRGLPDNVKRLLNDAVSQ